MLYDLEIVAAIALVVGGLLLIAGVWRNSQTNQKSEKIHFAAPPTDDAEKAAPPTV
jgi:hypothetical protein